MIKEYDKRILLMERIYSLFKSSPFLGVVSSMLKHTLAFKGWWYRYQHTKEVCPFIAYCIIQFKTVFHSLIFWRFLFLLQIAPNKKYPSILCVLQYKKCCFNHLIYERRHEISNNVVCATSKCSDKPAHTRSLIKAFASRLNILWI